MLSSNYIVVGGLIIGYLAIAAITLFVGMVTFELLWMKAHGVKIVRKKRQ